MTGNPQQLEHLQAWSQVAFRPDAVTAGRRQEAGLNGRIRLHDSVLNDIQGRPAISKRLAIAVQQLAALGRTTTVKGCSDAANRGWRRTPLGGRGGMHHYLWWTPQGSPQTKGVDGLARGAILLRTVRHHDDHRVLRPGDLDDYFELSVGDLAGDSNGTFESPWTSAQREFMRTEDPVRVVHGYPGSGKTMALWKAVESRGGRTLYLTWSSALIDDTRSRFSAFSSPDSQLDAREFRVFIGSLCGRDVSRLTLAQSRKAFQYAFPWWKLREHLGPWNGKLDALHAELRAVLFGRAVPGLLECVDDGRRLSDKQYRANTQVGPKAASALLAIIGRSGWRKWYERVFPELAAARTALERLREGHLPVGLETYDRVVVDEVQDLSLLESAVVVEYCRSLALNRSHAPWLLMAFDDGQTVRPSGFDPNRLNSLLSDRLAQPREVPLDHNVRSPSLISDVTERASNFYRLIGKNRRPKNQKSRPVEEEIIARLIHVSVPDRASAGSLLHELDDVADVAVVSSRETVPEWVPREHHHMVHTPESVKGLEYGSVCVLDGGKLIKQLQDTKDQGPLGIQARRTAIDGLRVAVSRATEVLVFVDVEASEREARISRDLLKNPEEFTLEDLTEFFRDVDRPLEERILVRSRDALALVDTVPVRAWQRACQALRLLGEPEEDAFESDEAIRREVCTSVLLVAARRMSDAALEPRERNEIADTARKVASVWGSSTQRRAFASFNHWTRGRAKAPFALLRATLALKSDDRKWLQSALPIRLQSLLGDLRRCAAEPAWAARYSGDVEAWLDLIGYTGDMAAEAEALRKKAVGVLAEAGKWREADRVLSRLDSPDPKLAGTILENLGRKLEAAEEFERAGLPGEALRNWRESGKLDRAIRLAEGEEKADLQWIVEMEKLAARRPVRLEARLKDAEKKRLNKTLQSARTPVRRRPGARRQEGLF